MNPNDPHAPPIAVNGGSAGTALAGGYEFGELENTTIYSCGRRARTWGIVAMVGGILCLIGLLFAMVMLVGTTAKVRVLAIGLPTVIVLLAIARRYMDAGDALIRVPTSQDNDVEHLLTALNDLAVVFKVEVIITLIGFVAGITTAVAGVPVAQLLRLLAGGG